MIEEDYLKNASKIIYQNKIKFDDLKNQKLAFVKLLKELIPGTGLKDAKDAADLYWNGNLPNCIKEERMDKLIRLEQLAKSPLVDEIIIKIKELDDSQMRVFLMELSIDDLLNIDQKFQK